MSQAVESSPPAPALAAAQPTPGTYVVGTLRYTRTGLFWVFIWLLWGDFIWTLLDGSVPSILPFKLKDMGASDTTNQVLNKALGLAVAWIFAPVVSMHSDRHRGRWGRRIPYLLWSTPFVGLFLILIGYYDSLTNVILGNAESAWFMGYEINRTNLSLLVFGALLIGYDFANIFVNTIYWYLFNDVVPEQFLSRFFALFRMVGTGAGALYSEYIFPHSLDHFRTVFVVAGICYVVGFMVMCFFVKEGEYPPPPENVDKKKGFVSACKTYAKECFTHRFYWYFFLSQTFMFMSWQSGTFGGLRNRDSLHLNMEQLGRLGFWTGIVSLIIMYPSAWLADKWHPVRVYILLSVIHFFQPLVQCIWIFTDFGPQGNLLGQYIISVAILPIGAVQAAAELPMYMRLLPKDRYGQFCSANATIRAFAMLLGSVAVGLMMDGLTRFPGDDWHYRYYAAWTVFWQIPAIIFLLLLYKEWKARGGDKGYTPPEA
ncbi:MAG: MFS transporter [Planctomycetota bacterium]|nr:MFS transporter [Planctomycetota bacterium]